MTAREWFREKGSPIATLMLASVIIGASIGFSARAHADPITDRARTYTDGHAAAVCLTLDRYPTIAGIQGIGQAIVQDGLTYREAGQVIGMSVLQICPIHTPELEAFVAMYANAGTVHA